MFAANKQKNLNPSRRAFNIAIFRERERLTWRLLACRFRKMKELFKQRREDI